MLALLALAMTAANPAQGDAALPASGTISVETVVAESRMAPSKAAFVGALGEVLARMGFTTLDQPGHAGLVVDLSISRAEVGTAQAAVDVPGPTAVAGDSPISAGGSIRVTLPTRKKRIVPLERTRMEIRIHRRGTDTPLWQGAAITVRAAGTPKGQDAAVATDLAEALLRNYPVQPSGLLSVP